MMNTIENVALLREAFTALNNQTDEIARLIRAEQLPAFMPGCELQSGAVQREKAIELIGRVRSSLTHKVSGVLCASQPTINAIEQLNVIKDNLKSTVATIKASSKLDAKGLQNLIKDELFSMRGEELGSALSAMGEKGIDLRTCYAHIKVLEGVTLSISWTWAMNHKRMTKCSVKEALELAKNLSEDARQAAEIDLRQLPPDEVLIQRIDMKPQLKANVQYTKNEELVKKAMAVSGVLVVPQATLPQVIWREQPESKPERMPRPKKAADKAIVPTLNLYRYE